MVRDQREDPDWWSSLPPPIRHRFAAPTLPEKDAPLPAVPSANVPEPARLTWLRDSTLLAAVFLVVAVANMAFLLLMLAFVDGTASPVP